MQEAPDTTRAEVDVPESFGNRGGAGGAPLRLLDGFSFVCADDPTALANLVDVREQAILALGTVLQPCDQAPEALDDRQALAVQLGPVLDWIIEYGANPAIWVCTAKAWYKLLVPSPDYAATFADVQRKYDFVIRLANAVYDNPNISLPASLPVVLNPPGADATSEVSYKEKDLLGEATFIYRQLTLWAQNFELAVEDTGSRGPPVPPALSHLRLLSLELGHDPDDVPSKEVDADDDAEDMEDMEDEDDEDGEEGGGGRARQRKRAAFDEDGQEIGRGRRRAGAPKGDGTKSKASSARPKTGGNNRGAQRSRTGSGRFGGAADRRSGGLLAPAEPSVDDLAGDEDELAYEDDEDELALETQVNEEEDASWAAHEQRERQAAEAVHTDPTASPSARPYVEEWDFDRNARILELRKARDAQRYAKAAASDAARGPPPAATADWRVEPDMVADVLSIWELCMAFQDVFQLPPFPVRALEAAILPGPLLKPSVAATTKPNGTALKQEQSDGFVKSEGGGEQQPDSGAGSVKHEDGKPQLPKSEPSADGSDLCPYDLTTMLDTDYLPSSLLLRDVHVALLRMIELGRPKFNAEWLEVAKDVHSDPKAELWTERTMHAVLAATGENMAPPEAREAALILQTREYIHLTPRQRLSLLRSLQELALSGDMLRDHIHLRLENMAHDRLVVNAALPVGANKRTYLVPMAANPGQAEDPEFWGAWAESCRLGMRKPIGRDFHGRRYWIFGGTAACWKVFVEAGEGSATVNTATGSSASGWGWYEGPALQDLIQWLRAGDIPAEAQLLKLLSSAPVPRRRPQGGSNDPWSIPEMLAARPNGYKKKLAPLLRGELNQPLPSNKALSIEERVVNCMEALLSDLDFWTKGPQWQLRCSRLIDVAHQVVKANLEMSRLLLETENMLHFGSAMRPVWQTGGLRDAWRNSLQQPGLSSASAGMHMATLQAFVADDRPNVITRVAFFRRKQEVRCPLYFPTVNEHVAVMRTGLRVHVHKYINLGRHHPEVDVGDLQAVQQGISQLHPVEQCRVMAIAYRSFGTKAQQQLVMAPQGGYPGGGGGEEAAAAGEINPARLAPPIVINPSTRPPVMWMLLQPSNANHVPANERPPAELSLPIHIDQSLADYVVKAETYEKGKVKKWQVGETFRMLANARASAKVGASTQYVRGTVVHIAANPSDPNPDPWEAITVEWEHNDGTGTNAKQVHPWEIEIDPENEPGEKKRKGGSTTRRARMAATEKIRQVTEDLQGQGSASGSDDGWKPEKKKKEDVDDDVSYSDSDADEEDEGLRKARNKVMGRGRGISQPFQAQPTSFPQGGINSAQAQVYARTQASLAAQGMRGPMGSGVRPGFAGGQMQNAGAGAYNNMAGMQQQRPAQQLAISPEYTAQLQQHVAYYQRMGQPLPPQVQEAVRLVQAQAQAQQAAAAAAAAQAAQAGGWNMANLPAALQHLPPAQQQQAMLALQAQRAAQAAQQQQQGQGQQAPLVTGGTEEPPVCQSEYDPPLPTPNGMPRPLVSRPLLQTLPQERDAFVNMVVQLHRRMPARKLTIPSGLDLFKVFVSVQLRGGYEAVCRNRQWLEIVRALVPPGTELPHNSPAGHTIRTTYERCLLVIEEYMASGQYESDVASGNFPGPNQQAKVQVPQNMGQQPGMVQQQQQMHMANQQRSRPPDTSQADAGAGQAHLLQQFQKQQQQAFQQTGSNNMGGYAGNNMNSANPQLGGSAIPQQAHSAYAHQQQTPQDLQALLQRQQLQQQQMLQQQQWQQQQGGAQGNGGYVPNNEYDR